jgi:hypothetical protein
MAMAEMKMARRSAPAAEASAGAAGPAGRRDIRLAALASALESRPASVRLRATAQALAARAPNRTGLPDALKAGVEALSGLSMDPVRVHRNSDKPARLGAHAYARGSEIHLAPGQERHLPHEAWHVVQQARGRVRPTVRLKGGVGVNDDAGLEREADAMGLRASRANVDNPQPRTALHVAKINSVGFATGQLAVYQGRFREAAGQPRFQPDEVPAKIMTLFRLVADFPPPEHEYPLRVNLDDAPGVSPADTTDAGGVITVNFRRWFVERSDIGEILGMFNHEVGVHTLADRMLTGGQKATERIDNANPAVLEHPADNGRANVFDRPAGLPIAGYRPDDWRQADHVNVARGAILDPAGLVDPAERAVMEPVQGSGPEAQFVPAFAGRALAYLNTMLAAGDAVARDVVLTQDRKDRACLGIVRAFFFDIARIIATDDTPSLVPSNLETIARLYTEYSRSVYQAHLGGHGWLLHEQATWGGLVAWLGEQVVRYMSGIVTNEIRARI